MLNSFSEVSFLMDRKNKIPVFPNWVPFNDMVFDGHLSVDKYAAVKTRSCDWDYRGPVLFYNSGRTARKALSAYGYQDSPSKHKVIVGVADLVEVRPLTNREAKQMAANFNNISLRHVNQILREYAPDGSADAFCINSAGNYIAPYDIGFFFQNPRRFFTPVYFNWPAGPVKPIFIDIKRNAKLDFQLALVE